MTALICAINAKYIHSSLAPWYLKASIEAVDSKVECKVLELTINESEDEIIRRILENKFDMIGFSTYIWNVSLVISICEKIKRQTDVEIFLGGPEVSHNAEEILRKHAFIDYVICGEGEIPVAELCSGRIPFDEIQGLCYRKNGEIVISEPFVSSEDPPCPYSKEYFDNLRGRIAYLETSRGCPYRCAFCLSGRSGGVRFFDLDRAKKDIISLANGGSKTIKFIDRTFNADKKRAKELFSFLIENYGKQIPRDVCFHFEIEGDLLDEDTLKILAGAPVGYFQMELGLQSFNQKTLNAINRKTSLERLCINTARLISFGNIHIHIDLIAGLPYENLDSFEESFNRALALKPHMLQLGFLKLLHGSDLRENPELYPCEYQVNAPYEVVSTPWIAQEELRLLHTFEDFFDKFYNSGRFPRVADYILENVKNPFKFYTRLALFVQKEQNSPSLDDFSLCIYDYLCLCEEIDSDKVRDLMAMDRLSTNRMGALPEFLRIHSPMLRECLNLLEQNPDTRSKSGIKRSITLLKTEKAFVYVDYDCKNPVTNQYKLIKCII